MIRIRTLIFFVIAVMIGLYFGLQLNTFLAISITEKPLLEPGLKTFSGDFSALPFRMVDLGGVGIDADSSNWGSDYSHNPKRFQQVFPAEEPFVDPAAFEKVFAQYCDYIDRMAAFGFNAVEIPGFLQFVDFDNVGTGNEIYPPESLYRKRHAVLRQYYSQFFSYAQQKRLQVILYTDMVALTPPLRHYFKQRFGGVDVDQDEFWQIYGKGLEELFEHLPMVDGIILRIGEAGAVYNRTGWDYHSELLVHTVSSTRKMLRTFLTSADKHNKYLIFRTWSVGVGETGWMHTDTKILERILKNISSERLIISTKFTSGDFWSHAPLNATLFSGSHKRIVEFQARREYEAFNVIPNYVAPLHQAALTDLLLRHANIEGVWVWTQNGGPLRHGPLMIYPFNGLWLWTDANVQATAGMIQNPGISAEMWAQRWVRKTFGNNEAVVKKMTDLLMMTHSIVARGLTIPQFARKNVRVMGLDIPPIIYIYWDIVDSTSSVAGCIYYVIREEIEETLQEAFAVVDDVRRMQRLLASVTDNIEKGHEWLPQLQASLEYERNLFETLAYHKQFLLKFYEWIDKGGRMRTQKWQTALEAYKKAKAVHLDHYQGNPDFPAYNFTIADIGALQAERTQAVILTARIFLAVLVCLFAGLLRKNTDTSLKPWALILFSVLIFGVSGAFSSFAAPVFIMTTGIPLLLYFMGLRFMVFRQVHPGEFRKTILPVLLLFALILTVLSIRGSFYFWFLLWTSDFFRLVLCAAGVPLILAHFYLVFTAHPDTLPRHSLIGRMFCLAGFLTVLSGLLFLVAGFETLLARLNDELLVMPAVISRVLGITTHLGIPLETPTYLVGAGVLMLVCGASLSTWRKARPIN